MPHPDTAVVTGAFSYTGRYITRRLLDEGARVRTLTGHPDRRDPFGGQVKTAPLDFSDRDGLCRSMQGSSVLYNTYWVRFERGQTTFDRAVENSRALFEAAAKAGVGRIVHISVSNASSDSRLPYFKGKGRVEETLKGPRRPLRHHQANPDLWRRRPAPQQHGLGAAALPVIPHLRQRRLPGSTHLCRRPRGAGSGCRFPDREHRCRRGRAGDSLLRSFAAPAGLRDGRPQPVRTHSPIPGPQPHPTGRPDDARRCAHARRSRRPHGRPADFRRPSNRYDRTEQLARR